MTKVIEVLTSQITTKGQEINDFKEKNNIRIRNQNELPSAAPDNEGDNKVANQGVLVGTKPWDNCVYFYNLFCLTNSEKNALLLLIIFKVLFTFQSTLRALHIA